MVCVIAVTKCVPSFCYFDPYGACRSYEFGRFIIVGLQGMRKGSVWEERIWGLHFIAWRV